MLDLSADELHLWLAQLGDFEAVQLQRQAETWLQRDEWERLQRVSGAARHRYLLGRCLLRRVLSNYAELEPSTLRFARSEQGKPVLAAGMPSMAFNLSHAGDRVVLAVARASTPPGVDIEQLARPRPVMRLASRYFCTAEAKWLARTGVAEQLRHFYRLWTLKEAYIKARGLVLPRPLHQLCLEFDADRINYRLEESGPSNATWRFWQYQTEGYVLALASPGRHEYVRVVTRVMNSWEPPLPQELPLLGSSR